MSRLVLFLQSAGYSRAYQAASLAVTAAAMGREVQIVLAFEALEQFVAGGFGAPSDSEREFAARAEQLGAASPATMLDEGRRLGVKVLACETVARITGVAPDSLRAKVDDVPGLATIVRLMDGAQVLYL